MSAGAALRRKRPARRATYRDVLDAPAHMVADLAGWRCERMPAVPDDAYFTLAPDWVCEVLSPSTRKFDLEEKRPIHAREEIAHLWLVDPSARTPGGFRLTNGAWSVTSSASNAAPASFPPFEAVSLPLDALWP